MKGLQKLSKTGNYEAFTVWMDMIVNEMSAAEIAESKEIPLAAVHEAIEYCQTHQDLLQQEAERECRKSLELLK